MALAQRIKPSRVPASLLVGAAFGPDVTIRELTDVEGAVSRFTGRPRPSDLDRLLMRLAAVVNAKRNGNLLVGEFKKLQGTAPLTLHEMKLTAGVACSCAICARIKRPLVPAIPGDENWDDFDAETETSENPF